MAKNISGNDTAFARLSYVLVSTLIPYIKIEGIDSIAWDDIEPMSVRKTADGKTVPTSKPVIFQGTITLAANSNARTPLDRLVETGTIIGDAEFVDQNLILTETNLLTGERWIYSQGGITAAQGGNPANMDEGQQPKTYRFSFGQKISMPL
jgi:hypothetical protein